jgi:hypothetical protein
VFAEPDCFLGALDETITRAELHDRSARCQLHGVKAARRCAARPDSKAVTAVARLGFLGRPHFELVTELEAYLAEHRRFILS